MLIDKLLIFDIKNKSANEFNFSPFANIIYSEKNKSGKSCLLKSLYYGLGLQIKNFAYGWNCNDMVFKIFYTHNSHTGSILRFKNNFIIDDGNQIYTEREYSEWLSTILNIKIKLPRTKSESLENIVASAILILFYIDQDTSWDKIPYKTTINLGWYEPSSIPKSIFEYVFGLKSSLNIELAEKIAKLKESKSNTDNQFKVLQELKNNFVSNAISSEIDESNIKNEINNYISYAEKIQDSVKKYKSKIYSERIKLDKVELQISELKDILSYNEKSYGDFKSICPQCNSVLTDSQVSERIELAANIYELKSDIFELEREAAKCRNKINDLLSENALNEKEHRNILSIANKKVGKLTLEQHLNNKSNEISKNKYYEIKNKLLEKSNELLENVRNLESQSKKLQKSQKEKYEIIKKEFLNILFEFSLHFSDINTEFDFLSFTQLKGSGADKNQKTLLFYMLYTKLLLSHSIVELPFVLDSIVKDELDSLVLEKCYKIIDKILLSSNKQSFFAVLDDKLFLLNPNHNKILIDNDKRLLSKEKFESLSSELSRYMSNTTL